MKLNTISSENNHVKFVCEKIRTTAKLPFADVLSEQSINKKLEDIEYRERRFPPDLTIFAFLSQVMEQDQSCQNAVARVIAYLTKQKKEIPSANTAAYCKARARLPEKVLSELSKENALELEEAAKPEWLWRGRHIKIPDGTTVSMPDTLENQARYPQPDSQKKGVGFPIARMVGVFSLATGALLDLAMSAYSGKGTGEHTLLWQLKHVFEENDIVLGDACYGSYFFLAMLMSLRVDGVFPKLSGRKIDFRKGKRIGKKDHLVQWEKPLKPKWMREEDYEMFPDTIIVRETSISCNRDGFRSKAKVIITTLTNEEEVTKSDLGEIYSYRWFVELDLRSVKEIMRMDVLCCKTPAMIKKEIWAHILAYNLVRKIMAQAGAMYKRRPREMSFKFALQMISAFRSMGILFKNNKIAYNNLLQSMVYIKTRKQLGRNKPRVVKRRSKAFPRMNKERYLYHKMGEKICLS